DLDPVEEARAFRLLQERFDLSQEQIAERVGKSRPAVANAMRILKLPTDIQDLLRTGELTRGHARALLALAPGAETRKLADRLVLEEMTVRSAEKATRSANRRGDVGREVDPNVRSAEERLQSRLGTRVKILSTAAGKGRIEISFDSEDELSRLF